MKKKIIAKQDIFDLLRGTIVAVIVSLILVLIFALLVNLIDIGQKVIVPVNQAIKIISIFIGCFIGIKNRQQGVIKGALIGLFYTFLSIFIFGIISKEISFKLINLVDMAFGIAAGIVSGILSVNLRKQ
ncbi:MAG: TIGR04086 family membrane protein [Clostridiales bacterium]|nr:TIGR04086 family membrane protein [Clostridiales bacterium]